MIELINVSKYYPTDFGRHYVFRNVSLKLPLDKSVGVIGPNGAGKSTFLRLLGGADIPSEGKILKTGRISPPMGLTPGLQNTLTAAENARFAGRIYGMERDEIADLIDYVRETANIGKFFDMPVGTYSAGMKQRVAFAINMSMTFDYYLFDEIGAGGDREFRKTGKAMVEERLKTSKFIIASHRTDELLDLCETGIVIKDGTLTFYDDIKDALAVYKTDDDEADGRKAKLAKRRAARKTTEGGDAASADATSERKAAKRASRKAARAAENGQAAEVADGAPLVQDATAAAADAAGVGGGEALRKAKRRKRRAKKTAAQPLLPEANSIESPTNAPEASITADAALASPDVTVALWKPRGEEAIGSPAPDTLSVGAFAPPPAMVEELSSQGDRQARQARKRRRLAKNAATIQGNEGTSPPAETIMPLATEVEAAATVGQSATAKSRRKARKLRDTVVASSGEIAGTGEAEATVSRAELNARRVRFHKARLKAREARQLPGAGIASGATEGDGSHPRLRGDEAIDADRPLQTISNLDGDQLVADARPLAKT